MTLNWMTVLGALCALPVVGVALYWLHAGLTHPPINDITTDIADPPLFRHTPAPAAYPVQAFAERQVQAYPDLVPLVLPQESQRVFRAALELVGERGWEVLAADADALQIEATAQSLIFRFTDEIVLRIRPEQPGVRIDMRSRSRVGRSDLGVNANRIRRFLGDLEARAGNR